MNVVNDVITNDVISSREEYHCIAPKFTLFMKGKPARELDSSQTRVYVSETECTPREVCIELN